MQYERPHSDSRCAWTEDAVLSLATVCSQPELQLWPSAGQVHKREQGPYGMYRWGG